jgi:hypothetical protein
MLLLFANRMVAARAPHQQITKFIACSDQAAAIGQLMMFAVAETDNLQM